MNKPFLKWAGGKHYAIDNINAFKKQQVNLCRICFIGK